MICVRSNLQLRQLLAQHEVDDCIDIRDVDLLVAVEVGGRHCLDLAEHHVDDGIDVGDVHLSITIDVTWHTAG